MRFEVINSDGMPVMGTSHVSCIPEEDQLDSMSKAGFKFKVDGKAISVKKIKEEIMKK